MASRAETSKLRTGLLAGAAVALLVGALDSCDAFERWEFAAHDLRTRWTIPRQGGHPEIVIVFITEECIEENAEKHLISWPWAREVFGLFFQAMGHAKARCVLFDVFTLVDPGPDDDILPEMLKQSPPVVVATPFKPQAHLDPDRKIRPDEEELLTRYAIEMDTDGSVEAREPYQWVVLPRALFARDLAGIADVATPREGDGIPRSYALYSKFKGRYYPSMALAGLMKREGVRRVEVRRGVARVGRVSIPLERDGTFRIRWYEAGPSFLPRTSIRVVSGFNELRKTGASDLFKPGDFEGKIVLFGALAGGLHDLRATPVAKVMGGTEIHATALANLLRGDGLLDAPRWVSLLVMAALALGLALSTRFATALAGGLVAAGALAALVVVNTLVYGRGWAVDLVPSVLAGGLAYAGSSALNFLYEGRQRQRIKRDFQKYMSPKVVEKILKNPDALSVAGEKKMLTVFFMDFAGFTSMAEKLDAAELVKLISEYHNEAAEEIFRTEGTIDKYIGDAIMAFWNDPIAQEDHAPRACLSALAAQARLREMAVKMRDRGLPEMTARIGINTGFATVGNMGAKHQVNYTVIGDEVNLASRLEGVNKEFGTEIVVSEATWLPSRDRVEARQLALIKVKGRRQPVRIFELLGARGAVDPARGERARAFERALADFQARRFREAREGFAPLAAASDPAAEVYAEVCGRYLAEPPPPDWDGSYRMETK